MKIIEKNYSELGFAMHTPSNCDGYLVFVHGGPGGNSGVFRAALQNFAPYRDSNLGWITYDQRGCGSSKTGEKPLSHETNIEDLAMLYRHLQTVATLPIRAVVGHSYGARLAFDCWKKHVGLFERVVLVGLGAQAKAPRNRALIMDLFALKIAQPNEYRNIVKELVEHKGSPWMLAQRVRQQMLSTDLRKFFYWGNLDAMKWCEEVKKSLPFSDDDQIFRTVRGSLYSDGHELALPSENEAGKTVLWIHGFQDFLMGGDSLEDDVRKMEIFFNSGHYPHLEEPERFVRELNVFLSEKAT